MSEIIDHPEIEHIETPALLFERFPEEADILNDLEKGKVLKIIDIDDLRRELALRHSAHDNQVDYTEIERYEAKNQSVAVELAHGENPDNPNFVPAVFKPLEGENQTKKSKRSLENYYVREMAAFLVDRHLRLGLVAPTVIRTIEDRGIGSLQYYIDPEIADISAHSEDFDWDKYTQGLDYQAIAMFDYLIANDDRHFENILFSKNDPPTVYPIDNSSSFKDDGAVLPSQANGPRAGILYQNPLDKLQKPRSVDLPQELLLRLEFLCQEENIARLTEQLQKIGLPQADIDSFWQRVQKMSETKTFQ